MAPTGEWNEWKNHVLSELKTFRHSQEKTQEKQEEILKAITDLKVQQAVLKTRMAILGMISGSFGGFLPAIIDTLSKMKK